MIKIFSTFLYFLVFLVNTCFANLYLETDYRERNRPKIVTKHHIFLDKRYVINYSKKSYVLILKKTTDKEATIESENYDLDHLGHKTMHGGSYGTYKVGNDFKIVDRDSNGRTLFQLKVTLQKIVPSVP